jgi:hypothetical protein
MKPVDEEAIAAAMSQLTMRYHEQLDVVDKAYYLAAENIPPG